MKGIAGGKGDQGAPGGDPNSKNYSGGGGHGNSGVTISRGLGGRHIVSTPSFTDDFNENNKVAIDVHVDENGNVIGADYDMRGSVLHLLRQLNRYSQTEGYAGKI